MKKNYYFAVIALIAVIVQSRLIPHPWNFTPVLAASIFTGYYFKNFYGSCAIIIFSMFIGDIYLGLHSTMFFTYLAICLIVAMGVFMKSLKTKEILIGGLSSSFIFFLITNFGSWLTIDMYEKSFSGLISAYTMAIPFFHNTLISTFLYLILFKAFFELSIIRKIRQ